jgi:hypothetical protein
MCMSICVGQLHQLILYAHQSLLAGSNLYEFMYIHIFSCFCCIGELGIGSNVTIGDAGQSTTVDFGPGAVVKAVSVGNSALCAIVNSIVKCWGYNYAGYLGQGNTMDLGDTPATIPAKIKPIK